MMAISNPSTTTLNADTEHSGLRALVLATFFISFIVFFVVLGMFFRSFSGSLVSDFYFALSCVVALPLSLGAAGLSEYVAKRKWPSGHSITFDESGVVAKTPDGGRVTVAWDGHVSTLKWYYTVKGYRRGGRERRVPAGTLCVCCQLQQDEGRFIVFSYLPEKRAVHLMEQNRFQELRPGDFYHAGVLKRLFSPPSRPTIPTKVLAGNQGHFWLAERRRWNEGMELTIEDFLTFMDIVNRRIIE